MQPNSHETEPGTHKISGITVRWDDKEHSVICYHFVGLWEWYDFAQASTQVFHMMAEVPHDVSLIFDLHHSLDVPVGALRAVKQLVSYAPANLDIIVIASDDKLTQQIFVNLLRLEKSLRKNITFSKSHEDAKILLRKHSAGQVN
jgi:hypothetical protein